MSETDHSDNTSTEGDYVDRADDATTIAGVAGPPEPDANLAVQALASDKPLRAALSLGTRHPIINRYFSR